VVVIAKSGPERRAMTSVFAEVYSSPGVFNYGEEKKIARSPHNIVVSDLN
jgi:hypothetical protein